MFGSRYQRALEVIVPLALCCLAVALVAATKDEAKKTAEIQTAADLEKSVETAGPRMSRTPGLSFLPVLAAVACVALSQVPFRRE